MSLPDTMASTAVPPIWRTRAKSMMFRPAFFGGSVSTRPFTLQGMISQLPWRMLRTAQSCSASSQSSEQWPRQLGDDRSTEEAALRVGWSSDWAGLRFPQDRQRSGRERERLLVTRPRSADPVIDDLISAERGNVFEHLHRRSSVSTRYSARARINEGGMS